MDNNSEASSETCGHGDHWTAIGVKGEEPLISLIQTIVKKGQVTGASEPLTTESLYKNLIYYDLELESIKFTAICGVNEAAKELPFLSAFPTMTKTEDWTLKIEEVSTIYGDDERVIGGLLASEHFIKWFVPYFGMEAAHWQLGESVVVALSALALDITPYNPEPVTITEGPALEFHKQLLRDEGNAAEADQPDFSVTVALDTLRMIQFSNHDHAILVGKVLLVEPLIMAGEERGWILQVECLPDEPETGYQIPLYVFDHLLEDGMDTPKIGDTIQSTAWLQGSWRNKPE